MAKAKLKRHPDFLLPVAGSIHGRSSTITAAFFSTITPVKVPSYEDVVEALEVLGMSTDKCTCIYCGGKKSEWDHLRPIVINKRPTGYITEIANLVPACGKCNQSKGNKPWREWIRSKAPHSPQTRGMTDLEERVGRLEAYERWRQPVRLDYEKILELALWEKHIKNWEQLLEKMKEAQEHAKVLRQALEAHL